jgi:hypothetical protein
MGGSSTPEAPASGDENADRHTPVGRWDDFFDRPGIDIDRGDQPELPERQALDASPSRGSRTSRQG